MIMVMMCNIWTADVQADLSLYWAHRSFCWFDRAAAQLLHYVYLLFNVSTTNVKHVDIIIVVPSREKTCLCHTQTTKAQISLRIHTV